jgi:uncharacterized damage-inducible protein DinB
MRESIPKLYYIDMRPPSLARHFAAEAHNNAWSNHRLLAACAQLTQEEFVAPRMSFFPSIKTTWNHILTVDWFYVEILERSVAGLAPSDNARRHFDPEEPFETCAEISREQHAVDQRLVTLCESLTDPRLDIPVLLPRRTGVVHDSLERILAHLFQHDIHHRGQIHAMLAGTSVKPPQLDEFYCANEAHLRAADLAALGTSEEEIWDRP